MKNSLFEEWQKVTPEQWQAAQDVAEAFGAWQTLNKQLESDPKRVPPEQMAAAWDRLIEAHERWANSR